MLFASWLRSLQNALGTSRPARRPIRSRHSRIGGFRPRLETLEDRTALSTVTWGGGSGDWETVSHWSTGALPTAADDVVIPSGVSVTHTSGNTESINSLTSSSPLNFSAGSLYLASTSTISNALTLTNTTLGGAGNLTISGLLTMADSSMTGSGTTNANGGANFNGANGEILDGGRTLNLAGNSTWGNTGYLGIYNGAKLNNPSGATFTVQGDQTIFASGPTGVFINAGTWTKNTTTGVTTINSGVLFNNTGTVNVATGALALYGGTNSGSFNLSSGTNLYFQGGNETLNSGTAFTGSGTVNFNGATTVVNGTSLTIANPATLSGGYLGGPAALTFSNTLTWTGGSMYGPSTTTIAASTGVLNLNADNTAETLDQRTLNNAGTINWSAAGSTWYLANGAVLNNQAGGTFNLTNDGDYLYIYGTTGTFNNAGTFNKSTTTGNDYVYVPLNNTGTVNVNAGTLSLYGGGTNSKTITTAAGATYEMAAGNFALNTGTVLTNNGTLLNSGGATTFGMATLSIPNVVTVSGGYFGGATTLTLTNTLNWLGGTIFGPGVINLTPPTGVTGHLNISGSQVTLDSTTLNTKALVQTVFNAAGYLILANGAIFNNAGTFTEQNDYGILASGTTGTFNNTGTFTKNTTTGQSYINTIFTNSKTVNVNTGNLTLAGGGSNKKTLTVSTGAELHLQGGTFYMNSGTAFTGTGTLFLDGATVSFAGTAALTIGLNTTFTNGYLTGPEAITFSKTLEWQGGTMNGAGSTTVASGAGTLNIDFAGVALDTRTLNNKGHINWTSGQTFNMYNGAVLNNYAGATFAIQCDSGIGTNGVTPTINNAGTIVKNTTTGVTYLYPILNNSIGTTGGTINVSTGELDLYGGGSNTVSAGSATLTTGAAAVLDFVQGYYSLATGTAVTGTGTLVIDGATVDASVNLSLANPVRLNNGLLTGSSTLTFSGVVTWNGGTMGGTGVTTVAGSGVVNLTGATNSMALDTRTLNNSGTMTWSNGYFYLTNSAIFNNNSGATFTITSDNYLSNGGLLGTINNAGTINRNTSVQPMYIYAAFNNTGTVNVNSATFEPIYGGTSTGTWAVAAAATLDFYSGTNNLNAGTSSITGAGNVTFENGTVDIAGTYNISGLTTLINASVTFHANASTGTYTSSGSLSILNGVNFTVSTGDFVETTGSTYLSGGTITVTGHKVDVQGGNFYGLGTIAGNLRNAGQLYVGGYQTTGTLAVTGTFTQTAAGTLYEEIGGNTASTQYDQLTVGGSATLGGNLSVSFVNGFSPATGTWTLMTYASKSGSFASIAAPGTIHLNATTLTMTEP